MRAVTSVVVQSIKLAEGEEPRMMMETRSKRRRKIESPPAPPGGGGDDDDYSNDSKGNALLVVDEAPHPHPLLTDLVLDTMMRCCSTSEMYKNRLVCREWNQASLRILKKSGPPIFLQHVDDHHHHRMAKGVKPKLLEDFLKEMHPKSTPPSPTSPGGMISSSWIQQYNKFNLELLCNPCRPLLDSFSKATGAWVTQLQLEFECPTLDLLEVVMVCKGMPNVEHFDVKVVPVDRLYMNSSTMNVMRPAQGVESKLKYLKIAFSSFDLGMDVNVVFPLEWKSLFRYHSKLEHFALGRPFQLKYHRQIEAIISAIGQLRSENNSNLSLKSLDFFGDRERDFKDYDFTIMDGSVGAAQNFINRWSAATTESLRKAALPLESLQLCYQTQIPEQVVQDILSIHGSSLKSFTFCSGTYYGAPLPLELEGSRIGRRIPMASLRNLTLNGYPFKDLNFLEELPVLRSLHLWADSSTPISIGDSRNIISATTVEMRGVEFSSLVQFCCNYPEKWTVDDDISKLKKLMPNLNHLELVLYNESFGVVCNLWPDLEHLAVFHENVGDMGIIGQNSSAKPNITCLQKLRTFSIDNLRQSSRGWQGGAVPPPPRLTKKSVEQGFLKLPHLEKLTFCVHRLINQETRSILKSQIPFAEVWRSIPSEDSLLRWSYLHRRRNGELL